MHVTEQGITRFAALIFKNATALDVDGFRALDGSRMQAVKQKKKRALQFVLFVFMTESVVVD